MQKHTGQCKDLPSDNQHTAETTEIAPSHLMRLPTSEWMVWHWAGLRSAGFPLAAVLQLATPACAEAADRLLQAEEALAEAQQHALHVLYHEGKQSSEEQQRALSRLSQRIRKKKPVEQTFGIAAVAMYSAALNKLLTEQAAFEQTFDAALAHGSQAIYAIAQLPRFQEAVTWQNRHGFHSAVLSLLRHPPQATARTAQRRQNEALIARYWQRYCTKNDTIGFFGPRGWARFTSTGPALTVTPGPTLLQARRVYFEGWGIDALAQTLTANPALRPWMVPRAMPFIYLDGCTVWHPEQQPIELSAVQALVLQHCDGTRTARDLAAHLIRVDGTCFADEAAVFTLLEQLVAANLIVWAFEVPLDSYPERKLRALLKRIDDPQLAAPALAMLDELEHARERVAQAAGNPAQLDQAIGALESTFTRLTETDATRLAGQIYAARTLVYEDCRRHIDVELGPQFTQALGNVLSLVLASARWFTWEAAKIYRRVFQEIYSTLVAETGSHVLNFATFWQRAQSTLFSDIRHDHLRYIAALTQEHQTRWSTLLKIPAGERRVSLSSAALREQVYATFAAPGPGWQAARYHSPDVMIAAPSADAIRRGDYQCVLGELHMAVNTLRISSTVNQHPQPAELIAAMNDDFPNPRVVLIEDKDWPEFSERSRVVLIAPKDVRLAFAANTCELVGSQIVTVGSLVIEQVDDTLVVRSRDGQQRYDVIEVFADTLSIFIASSWKIVPPAPYTPRITIDTMVVCRETWRFAASEILFAFEKEERARFLGARRWARSHALPRHVFVKVPVEAKPVYLDFDSPILVDNFAKFIRRTAKSYPTGLQVTLTEMLPNHDQVWLPDAADQRYTCELRIIAVDQKH